jgi:hypothetical protein
MNIARTGFVGGSFLLSIAVVCLAASQPKAPVDVKAERQDFQAARITWKKMGNDVRYVLYAAYDRKPLDFHKENDGNPMAENFAIWDAPRKGGRRFVFYVTAVDREGRESEPSKHARIDLGPLP